MERKNMKGYFFLVVNSLLLLLMSINFAFGFVQEARDEARLLKDETPRECRRQRHLVVKI